jgi:hypothetical protein
MTFSCYSNPHVRGYILIIKLIPKLSLMNLVIFSWHPFFTNNPNRYDSPTSFHRREPYILCLADFCKSGITQPILWHVYSWIAYGKTLSKLLPYIKACILSVPITFIQNYLLVHTRHAKHKLNLVP